MVAIRLYFAIDNKRSPARYETNDIQAITNEMCVIEATVDSVTHRAGNRKWFEFHDTALISSDQLSIVTI